jgi:hypothetical protein
MKNRDVPVYLAGGEIAFLQILLGQYARSHQGSVSEKKAYELSDRLQDALDEYGLDVVQA